MWFRWKVVVFVEVCGGVCIGLSFTILSVLLSLPQVTECEGVSEGESEEGEDSEDGDKREESEGETGELGDKREDSEDGDKREESEGETGELGDKREDSEDGDKREESEGETGEKREGSEEGGRREEEWSGERDEDTTPFPGNDPLSDPTDVPSIAGDNSCGESVQSSACTVSTTTSHLHGDRATVQRLVGRGLKKKERQLHRRVRPKRTGAGMRKSGTKKSELKWSLDSDW